MNKYYEVKATHEGTSEVLYGSFDRTDCTYEVEAERDSWKSQGYKGIKIVARAVNEEPDPEVYNTIMNDIIEQRGGHYCHALEVESLSELESTLEAIYDDFARTYSHYEIAAFMSTLAIYALNDENENDIYAFSMAEFLAESLELNTY
tara:strand:- start:3505 stop:3948 length:444 start_codon:yes stop_codon:yes gene_type:complete